MKKNIFLLFLTITPFTAYAEPTLSISHYELKGTYADESCPEKPIDPFDAHQCARHYAIKLPYISTSNAHVDKRINELLSQKSQHFTPISIKKISGQPKIGRSTYEEIGSQYRVSYYQYPLLSILFETGGCSGASPCSVNQQGLVLDISTGKELLWTDLIQAKDMDAINAALIKQIAEKDSIPEKGSRDLSNYPLLIPGDTPGTIQCYECTPFVTPTGVHVAFSNGIPFSVISTRIPEQYLRSDFVNKYSYYNILE